jgi:hypothetical protein
MVINRFIFVFIFLLLQRTWHKKAGGKYELVSSRQKYQSRVLFCVTTNWLCVKKSKKSSVALLALWHIKTFLCLSGFFMLTSAHMSFYACWAFLCLLVNELLQFLLIIVKKMKSTSIV